MFLKAGIEPEKFTCLLRGQDHVKENNAHTIDIGLIFGSLHVHRGDGQTKGEQRDPPYFQYENQGTSQKCVKVRCSVIRVKRDQQIVCYQRWHGDTTRV